MGQTPGARSSSLLARIDTWLRALNRRRLLRRRHAKHRATERSWMAAEDPSNPGMAGVLHTRFAALREPAVVSIVMRGPARDARPGWPWHRGAALTANWCLVDAPCDALLNIVHIVQTAPSDVIALLPAGHALAPHAPMMIAEAVAAFPRFALIYGDEDCFDDDGRRHNALLHCNWNAELLRSTPYLSGLVVARRSALLALPPIDGAVTTWWGLLLRLTEGAAQADVVHIPHVLSHCVAAQRMSRQVSAPAATAADVELVRQHLGRCGVAATVEAAAAGGVHVRYAVPAPAPLVSLIIPTRNGLHLLRQCVQSILERTTYTPYELVIVDNGSDDPATLHYLRELQADERIRVQRDDRPFNFAALNNAAVPLCRGHVLGFVNNDVEVITPGWLDEMVGLALRADVGAVGARLWFSNATLQHAGVILGIGGVAAHIHQRLPREQPGYLARAHVTQEFSAVTAACMLMRRDVFERVNGFDEVAFAVDYNDIDLCLRVRSAGYRVVWTPHAELFHHESATRGNNWNDEQKARHAREVQRMRERWARWLDNDPAYNPNASLKNLDFAFSIATEPRVSLSKPWFDQLP